MNLELYLGVNNIHVLFKEFEYVVIGGFFFYIPGTCQKKHLK